ncbi:hypothetical protein CAAN1_04S00826 [[Candida] anglica]|uniref:C2H2-type domain-containing protein n=1 Tax=[Candida] anglica TaxID=148631 RepID=A0ABP0E973_9ASCO
MLDYDASYQQYIALSTHQESASSTTTEHMQAAPYANANSEHEGHEQPHAVMAFQGFQYPHGAQQPVPNTAATAALAATDQFDTQSPGQVTSYFPPPGGEPYSLQKGVGSVSSSIYPPTPMSQPSLQSVPLATTQYYFPPSYSHSIPHHTDQSLSLPTSLPSQVQLTNSQFGPGDPPPPPPQAQAQAPPLPPSMQSSFHQPQHQSYLSSNMTPYHEQTPPSMNGFYGGGGGGATGPTSGHPMGATPAIPAAPGYITSYDGGFGHVMSQMDVSPLTAAATPPLEHYNQVDECKDDGRKKRAKSTSSMRNKLNLMEKPLYERLQENPTIWKTAHESKKGNYKCSHCSQAFATLLEFATHLDQFKVRRVHLCPVDDCPWSIIGLQRKAELRRHCISQHFSRGRVIHHEGDQQFIDSETELQMVNLLYSCNEENCKKHFYRKDSLQRHQKLVHSNKDSKFNKRWHR